MGALAKGLAALAVCCSIQAVSSPLAAQDVDPFAAMIELAAPSDEPATDLQLRATLYWSGTNGVGHRDSLGCRVTAMRTLAVDPRVIPKRSIVYIRETVGMTLPDGSVHDGLWYASDTGGAIRGNIVDLFTGSARASRMQFAQLTKVTLNAAVVGVFEGCPPN